MVRSLSDRPLHVQLSDFSDLMKELDGGADIDISDRSHQYNFWRLFDGLNSLLDVGTTIACTGIQQLQTHHQIHLSAPTPTHIAQSPFFYRQRRRRSHVRNHRKGGQRTVLGDSFNLTPLSTLRSLEFLNMPYIKNDFFHSDPPTHRWFT